LGWLSISPADHLVKNNFITESIVLLLEQSIIQQTINLRKTANIKMPDAVIAATASVHNPQLLTHNILDFESIAGLILIDAGSLSKNFYFIRY
jgi:predicted nucleic acid-binding protein